MSQNIKLIVYPSKDIEAAKTFYTEFFEVEPYAESQYYVGYKTEHLEIGLDPNAQEIITYIDVDNIQDCIDHCTSHGATLHQGSKDVGGGMMIAQIKDPNGNIIGIRQSKD
jgi:predicted enzyme related to lactoylglutathione lyase